MIERGKGKKHRHVYAIRAAIEMTYRFSFFCVSVTSSSRSSQSDKLFIQGFTIHTSGRRYSMGGHSNLIDRGCLDLNGSNMV
jgi:hypothetical protein